jgi:uncharacterized protein (TIGR02301 family)
MDYSGIMTWTGFGAASSTLVLAAWLGAAPLALAQQTFPETPEGRRAKYSADLRDLSRVLGGAHYLRILCLGNADQSWRDYMREMLTAEPPRFRQELAALFNAGYRAEEERFPVCSPQAQTMETELMKKGMRLADWLAAHNKG